MDFHIYFSQEFPGIQNAAAIEVTKDIMLEHTEAIANHKRWEGYHAHAFGDHPNDKADFLSESQKNIDNILKQLDIVFLN